MDIHVDKDEFAEDSIKISFYFHFQREWKFISICLKDVQKMKEKVSRRKGRGFNNGNGNFFNHSKLLISQPYHIVAILTKNSTIVVFLKKKMQKQMKSE